MTKSNWRNELYLGERVGGAGTLVRQGIKIGGKKGCLLYTSDAADDC